MRKKAIEIDGQGETAASPARKDKDARRVKTGAPLTLGYKQHIRTDEEGHIEKPHITAAHAHESKHLAPLPEGVKANAAVYADKGYDSKENRTRRQEHNLRDRIMRRAQRNTVQSQEEKERNKALSETRYVVEQTFGTLHRKLQHKCTRYFGFIKVAAQSHLKAICINLLKAGNRVNVSVPA